METGLNDLLTDPADLLHDCRQVEPKEAAVFHDDPSPDNARDHVGARGRIDEVGEGVVEGC